MGILTDGKRWLLRWPGAGDVRLTRPFAFTLDEPDRWLTLWEWLRDSALVSLEGEKPDREGIRGHFGPSSPSYQRDIAFLKTLYQENAELDIIQIKRRFHRVTATTMEGGGWSSFQAPLCYCSAIPSSPVHYCSAVYTCTRCQRNAAAQLRG